MQTEGRGKNPLPLYELNMEGNMKWQLFEKIHNGLGNVFYLLKILLNTSVFCSVSLFVVSVLNGIIPSFSTIINARILDVLSYMLQNINSSYNILKLIGIRFVLLIAGVCLVNLYDILVNLSSVQVIDKLRKILIKKARSIDLSSYDSPVFYGQLENAMQEISTRPVSIFLSLCMIISNIVGLISYLIIVGKLSILLAMLMLLAGLPQIYISSLFKKNRMNII